MRGACCARATRSASAGEGGIWYGGDSLETACAEVAYWRDRFIIQSAGLAKDDSELVTRHTFFRAVADGVAIDLTSEPWSVRGETWTHPTDYTGTQALAGEARSRGIEWIRYASVRSPGAQEPRSPGAQARIALRCCRCPPWPRHCPRISMSGTAAPPAIGCRSLVAPADAPTAGTSSRRRRGGEQSAPCQDQRCQASNDRATVVDLSR